MKLLFSSEKLANITRDGYSLDVYMGAVLLIEISCLWADEEHGASRITFSKECTINQCSYYTDDIILLFSGLILSMDFKI